MADNPHTGYVSALAQRNASAAMQQIFSAHHKHATWRRLWVALAEAQRSLGLDIPARAIQQMKSNIDNIDWDETARLEKQLRHDVMAHVHAFGIAAPQAKGIIHLGATSAFVGDNTDLIILREALQLVRTWLVNVIDALANFAKTHRALPTLGFTHFQPAQLTTVGKRAACWCYDFIRDLDDVEYRLSQMRFRGAKGTTGTQASFLALFDGDADKVASLDRMTAEAMGFDTTDPVVGQTYSRKVDAQVIGTLANIAGSVHKMANDVRLLCGLKEMDEPFETSQIGSSAMAYKRNPMRCERATGLARFVISLASSPLLTHAEQWLERTLDDSANRRLSLSEPFLATDGMLTIMLNVAGGLKVYPKTIAARIDQELPFMATENILMAAVAAGGDRQDLHERIRTHSQAAAEQVKQHGRPNDLLERLRSDDAFANVDIDAILKPKQFIGLAPRQVDEFIRDYVTPIRRKYRKELGATADLKV